MATIFGQTVPDADPVAMIGARGTTADGTGIEAAAVSVLDTAGNYTATDVEAVLAELPSRFAPVFMRPPTGAKAETVPRLVAGGNGSLLSSGRETLVAIFLTPNTYVSVTFRSATTALGTGSNQWFTLRNSDRELLSITADDTSTAWLANSFKTLTLADPVTVPTAGWYYVGIMVNASTVPTLQTCAGASGLLIADPAIVGQDNTNTGLTNPASAPATSAALTASTSNIPYAYVS